MRLDKIIFTEKNYSDISALYYGVETLEETDIKTPSIRNHFIFNFVKSGTGVFKNSSGEFSLKQGDLFIIKPDEKTYFKSANALSFYYLAFSISDVLKGNILQSVVENSLDFNSRFNTLEEIKNGKEEFALSIIYSALSTLIKEEKTTDYIERVKKFIDCSFMTDITVENIADAIGLDRRYLSRIFKKATGMTIKEYVVTIRLKTAGEYIKNGYSVTTSANMAGYKDLFNFSKMFKKYFGVCPKKYGK